MASRNYMCTVFFPDGELSQTEMAFYWASNLDEVFADPLYRYACFNIEECPTTRRPHWQMYTELNRPARFTQLQRTHPVFATAHYEPRMGTQDEAIAYCTKTETRHPLATRHYEWGVKAPGQGYRSDMDSLSQMVLQGMTDKQIATEAPGMFIRFHNGIRAAREALESDSDNDDDFEPRPWQKACIDLLSAPADDRTILWYTDEQGGMGKTRLATHLIKSHNAIELSGKMADMTYAYSKKRQPIVIFDISRAAADMTSHIYSMAEKLKSGRLMNTKYQSRQFTFKPPHVIIFSNSTWDKTKFSLDRVKETKLQATSPAHQAHRFM